MLNYILLLPIFCLLFLTTSLQAQKNKVQPIRSPFTAAILTGGSVSQVNGDESQGFNKLGVYGGVITTPSSVTMSLPFHFSLYVLSSWS